jgi:thioredoxin:protein disulfide reductase
MITSLIISSLLIFAGNLHATINFNAQKIDNKTIQLKVSFDLKNQELLYKDSINFSIDAPDIKLSDWHSNKEPVSKYDEISKKTKIVFDKPTTITLYAIKNGNANQETYLYLTYQTNKLSSPKQKLFKLPMEKSIEDLASQNSARKNIQNTNPKQNPKLGNDKGFIDSAKQTWTGTLSHLVAQTNAMPIRLILVFLLGVLLSFTPCCYPMIPITAGILHAHRSSSLLYNFLLSLAYTIGLSTTFACFGLLAGYTGPLYGKLLVHPVSVAILVVFLVYIALSLFGFYNLYIPTFLQRQHGTSKGGSLFSCFLLGIASGSIASPCISPGLILLLSIVATLGSYLLGFLLLFFFGVGLSMPLLIVGTFSNSLSLLPKAGYWMVEIKKLFGIMLLALCFYYLSNVLAPTTIYYLISITIFFIGIYYLYTSKKILTKRLRQFHNLFGNVLIICAMIGLAYTYQSHYYAKSLEKKSPINWYTNYQEALKDAQKENKLVFIDFWAQYCSVCKAIDATLLSDPAVVDLFNKIIAVKVNGTNDAEAPYKNLKKQFNIFGFPTFLLIDPTTQQILKHWNSDLYHTAPEEFVNKIYSYIYKKTQDELTS